MVADQDDGNQGNQEGPPMEARERGGERSAEEQKRNEEGEFAGEQGEG